MTTVYRNAGDSCLFKEGLEADAEKTTAGSEGNASERAPLLSKRLDKSAPHISNTGPYRSRLPGYHCSTVEKRENTV